MATLVTPTNLQKIEFDVTTTEGPSRVTIVTGMMPIKGMILPLSTGSAESSHASFKSVLDPALTPGQFRKATATAVLGSIQHSGSAPPNTVRWQIEDAQATFDDEASQVQLVVDVEIMVTSSGTNTQATCSSIMFQVTTLARV
jgi:hypothetical protein